MAITATLLDEGEGTNADPSVTDNDITPSANTTVLVIAALGNDITGLTGCGITWTQIHTILTPTGGTNLYLFRGSNASPTTGKLSFNVDSADAVEYGIVEFPGTDTATDDGVVQAAELGDDNATSLTVTLSAFASTDNATVGAFATSGNASTWTPGSGFTLISEAGSVADDFMLEFKASSDTSVDASWVTTRDSAGIAVELKSGSSFIPRITIT